MRAIQEIVRRKGTQACIAGARVRIDTLVHMVGIFAFHDLTPESREIYDARRRG